MPWEAMKRIAYGPLGLMPESFYRLTYGQFLELIEGYKFREQREWDKLAQLASWTTAPHLKRPVSAKKLLGKEKKKEKTTPKESKRLVEELKAEMVNKEGGE